MKVCKKTLSVPRQIHKDIDAQSLTDLTRVVQVSFEGLSDLSIASQQMIQGIVLKLWALYP